VSISSEGVKDGAGLVLGRLFVCCGCFALISGRGGFDFGVNVFFFSLFFLSWHFAFSSTGLLGLDQRLN
jgi:hypothetical protein